MALAEPQVPQISEDDLLAFQYSHFGDDSKPDTWFVDIETALQQEPDDGAQHDELGYYDDGAKRTLTDDQIAMFRHSELEQLRRQRRLQREEEGQLGESDEERLVTEQQDQLPPHSPVSDVSSLEDDLVGLPRPAFAKESDRAGKKATAHPRGERAKRDSPKPSECAAGKSDQHAPAKGKASRGSHGRTPNARDPSQSSRSDTSKSTDPATRTRRVEVPYDQRHKRKWEDYIDENDPVHGSLTHRRMVRQLDEQRAVDLDIDYGDDLPAQTSGAAGPVLPSARRVVSYDDD